MDTNDQYKFNAIIARDKYAYNIICNTIKTDIELNDGKYLILPTEFETICNIFNVVYHLSLYHEKQLINKILNNIIIQGELLGFTYSKFEL